MKLFGWLSSLFDDADTAYSSLDACNSTFLEQDDVFNPANGLPMIGGFAGVDIDGNLYGADSLCDSSWDSTIHGCGISDFGGDW
jgi:hypothetical protein